MAEEILDNEGQEQEEIDSETQKTYTQEEVLALLQKESDKRVRDALKKQQKKYEKQLSLSKLDGSEREKAEKDNRIAELEEQLAQFQTEKNRSELKSVLSSRGLSAEFADIIAIGEDIEAAQANIDKLDNLFKAAVRAEVEARLKSKTPEKGIGGGDGITPEQFRAMPLSKQMDLFNRNPDLYKKLVEGK